MTEYRHKGYLTKLRAKEEFKIFRKGGSVPVKLFVGNSNGSIGIEIEGVVSLFLGNFDKKYLRQVEKQARELGFREEKKERETMSNEAGILKQLKYSGGGDDEASEF